MQSVTAIPYVVMLSVLLGSSSGVRAANNFVLVVNTTTGQAFMRSDYPSTVWINQYSIASAGSLRPVQWNSLDDQEADGSTWHETSATTTLLSESNPSGQTSFQTGTGFNLGALFGTTGSPQDLVLHYRLAGSATPSLGVVMYGPGPFTSPPNPVNEAMPCLGDINGSGAVNVDDLLQVINSWGPCPPRCPADIAPAQVGNGTVNVDDLLAVINAWGVCP